MRSRDILEKSAFDWLAAYLQAFYREHLWDLGNEILDCPGIVLKPLVHEELHHWHANDYQNRLIVFDERLVAPVRLEQTVDFTDFWGLVNNKEMSHLISSGLVYPLPYNFPLSETTDFNVAELPGFEFALSSREIRKAFSGTAEEGLFMPLPVGNLSMQELLDLRQELADDWRRWQHAGKKLMEGSSQATSEGKILELAREVNDAILTLNAHVEEKDHELHDKAGDTALGACGFILSLVTPIPEVQQLIAAVLGSFSAIQGLQYFRERAAFERKLRAQSSYYFPFKVSQLDKGRRSEIAELDQVRRPFPGSSIPVARTASRLSVGNRAGTVLELPHHRCRVSNSAIPPHRAGVDAMVANRVRMMTAGCVVCAALAVPTTGAAQNYRYADDEPAVVVECAPGQRAVMAQRRVNGTTQVVARCEGPARAVGARRVSQSNVRYVERAPQRTKTKTALMIAGSAATGAGVGGALKGKNGAIIGAAIGGGSASIYEAAKQR